MPGWAIAAIVVPLFVMLDLVIVTTVFRAAWAELAQGFGAVPPAPGAVRRDYQSFAAGMFNLGYSVHVAVDESHLHLFPARVLRWTGARAVSIPWDALTLVKPGPKWTRVKLGATVIKGPTWCLAMAS